MRRALKLLQKGAQEARTWAAQLACLTTAEKEQKMKGVSPSKIILSKPKLCADDTANSAALASTLNGSPLTSLPVHA